MKRLVVVLGMLFVAACAPVKPPAEEPPPVPCDASPSVATSLRPDALNITNGSPTPVGAGTIVECVADESDATYVDLDSGSPSDDFWVGFPEEPVGATAWLSATVHVRAARPSGASSDLQVRVADFSSGSNYLVATGLSVTTSPGDFAVPLTSVPTTADDIADLSVQMRVATSSSNDNFRVYRIELVIEPSSPDAVGAIPVGF